MGSYAGKTADSGNQFYLYKSDEVTQLGSIAFFRDDTEKAVSPILLMKEITDLIMPDINQPKAPHIYFTEPGCQGTALLASNTNPIEVFTSHDFNNDLYFSRGSYMEKQESNLIIMPLTTGECRSGYYTQDFYELNTSPGLW
ncbi:hypothetical protein [Thalassomonas sp. RHCl1]|uniref:hypothetical protein n=1 Tax=Thalassomonas sp. RHCl1 TaxID=2995320 RepID=UPI00248CBA53|nr:hypothetical protein [Thalassomonas sp. RHCl1]